MGINGKRERKTVKNREDATRRTNKYKMRCQKLKKQLIKSLTIPEKNVEAAWHNQTVTPEVEENYCLER